MRQSFAEVVIEALSEAAVEIRFRREDAVRANEGDIAVQSIDRTLAKVRSAESFMKELVRQTKTEMRAQGGSA